MLRLQGPLPEGYSTSTREDLARRIGEAKANLGSRLMILGHHYQRDEVMCWADARGDSFGLRHCRLRENCLSDTFGIEPGEAVVTAVAFSSDGKSLYSEDVKGDRLVWDVYTGSSRPFSEGASPRKNSRKT